MGVKHSTVAVLLIASVVVVSGRAIAVALGELQAVPSNPPPYVFRLAILPAPHGSLDTPAVTVHQPHDALSLVKNNTLELRLRSLTDVELEVSDGGQTLNRLLMKSELLGARARLDATTSWGRYQAGKAKNSPRPQLIALLDTAYQTHRAWGRFDPIAAQQPLAQVTQERLRVLAADARPAVSILQDVSPREGPLPEGQLAGPGTDGTPGRSMLERELLAIREEMRDLMARVTPWAEAEAPARQLQGHDTTPFVPLLLGGVLMAGLISLFMSYRLQRRVSDRAQQRRRAFAAAVRRARGELMSGTSRLPEPQRHQLLEGRPTPSEFTAVVRHLRVSHKTKRRVRVQASPAQRGSTQPQAAARTQVVARISHAGASTPSELIEALGNLRQDLLNLQRVLVTSTPFRWPASSPGRRAR
jgi:hypothetical protein